MTNKAPSESLTKGNCRISLFHLFKRTPAGLRLICRDLTFSQAAGLLAEIPATIVKFSRMEAAQ
ncbi:hypothetical protein [Methylobacter sp. BlB1]|uniref:hypothetical protein n=1 Tax=Methylobacter sp. BlB1 TaxID=2785914 RepID=UPI0018939662|nr:hypothetical protein [Methylobacter sp. BlB1]MBF6649514.1 hypothetical protein [Methylobacter sp. BlB1]